MVYVSGSLPTGGEDEGAWEESAAFFLENGAIDTLTDMQALVLIKPSPSVGHPPADLPPPCLVSILGRTKAQPSWLET